MPLFIYTDYTPNAVQPVECLKAGWTLIKDQYWLFAGMTLVALLVGQIAPFGILMAPMMCGLYLAFFQRMRGQPVEFSRLFDGFEFFGQSLIAMLIHIAPVFILMAVFASFIGFGVIIGALESQNGGLSAGIIAILLLLGLIFIVILLVVNLLFTFAFPLIVDRRLSGVEAVKLSVKAAQANFWALLGLVVLNGLLGLAGVLFCYVGALLVMPVTFAATACAYQQVFGLAPLESLYPPGPPREF